MELVRGDTEQIVIEFVREGRPFTPADLTDGDIFTLTVRDKFSDVVVLQKQIGYPNLQFNLLHTDTKALNPGEYRYDIEYSKPDKSVVKTLICGAFVILRDVTEAQ